MLSTIIKLIILIVLIVALVWVGATVYSCFNRSNDTGMPKMPDAKDAKYGVYIENTGNLLLTDNYESYGDEPGSKTYVLHGFWEAAGSSFKYRAGDIILEERLFGKITIRRR